MNGSFLRMLFRFFILIFHSHVLAFCVCFKPLFHHCRSFFTLCFFFPITTWKVQSCFSFFYFQCFSFALCMQFVLLLLLFPFLLQCFLFCNSWCFFFHCWYFMTIYFHHYFVVSLMSFFYQWELTCFTDATKLFPFHYFFLLLFPRCKIFLSFFCFQYVFYALCIHFLRYWCFVKSNFH
jgi:hypothetical protein